MNKCVFCGEENGDHDFSYPHPRTMLPASEPNTAPPVAEAMPAVEVKVKRGRVWIVKGVQSFMLAYEADTDELLQWYANQLCDVLSIMTPCVKSGISEAIPAQAVVDVSSDKELAK